MSVFLLKRSGEIGIGEDRAMVVLAENEERAREVAAQKSKLFQSSWVTVVLMSKKEQVVLTSK